MTQLGSLYLNGNRFTGTIPVALARMSNLSMLNLSNNRLEGRLPAELAELVKKSKPCWLTLSSNKLSGPIPDEFRDVAGYQPYVDFSYNGLYANSAGVFDFIGRHHMKDFASTQSAGPFSLTVQSVSGNSVQLAWDPISYAADNGGYEVLYRKGSDGPLAVYAMTPDKTVNSVTVAGLEAGTTYSFILRTITYPHAKNQNTVVGEPARFVTATTAQTAEAWFPFAPAVGQSAGLAMTNPGTSEMKVQVSALNNAGTLLPLPANPASFAIPPGRHLAAMTPQIFGSEPLAPAWIRVAADQTLVSLGMIQGPGYLDGIPGFTRLHKVLYFPRVYGSSIGGQPPPPVTTISLVNPGEGLVQVSLEVRGHEVAAAPVTRAIPPRGQLWETVDSLFPGQSFGQVYLVATVTEGEGVAGLAMVNAGGGRSLYIVPGQPISGANRLFSAQVASGPGIRTSFRLVNASAEPRTVTVRLVQEDGSTVEPLVLTVPGGGLTEGEVGATFQLDSARLSAASLDVTADAGGILGDVVVYQFGRPGIPGLEYASELALDNRLARRAYLGYVANSPGIFTGLAFYNPGSEDADVTVDVYSEDGTLKGTTSFELPAGGRLARTVPELVPAAAGWSRGYIYIRSTAPLALQELFVDERLQYLSTVPAVIL